MRSTLVSAFVATGSILAPALAVAQHTMGGMPAHELGVDLLIQYQNISPVLPGPSVSHVTFGSPVDVRLGFVVSNTVVVEPRLAFAFDSKGASGQSAFAISPLDVNVLFNVGGDANYKKGLYLTAGAGVSYATGGGSSATQFSVNGGFGTRVPYESGALRIEAFVREQFKNTSDNIPGAFDVGARVGLSLWH